MPHRATWKVVRGAWGVTSGKVSSDSFAIVRKWFPRKVSNDSGAFASPSLSPPPPPPRGTVVLALQRHIFKISGAGPSWTELLLKPYTLVHSPHP